MRTAILSSLALVLILSDTSLQADQLRITSARDWREWQLPGDAIQLIGDAIKPGFVRRDINAVANAGDFGGGIREVGTNPQNAFNLIDGDQTTSWSPGMDAPLEDWWIEVDLGRVVSARKIQLYFAQDGNPLEFFKVLTSDGEPFFSNANSILPGTLRYNKRTRYSFNEEYLIEIDFELDPLQNIRIQADRRKDNVHLTQLVVESVGDNLSLGVRERGGSVGIISEVGSKTRELVESVGISGTLIDGDITTYWGTVHRGGSGTQAEQQFGQFEIDLGVLFWVDRVRLLGDNSGIAPAGSVDNVRSRAGVMNYLWYRLFGSDGSRAPDGSLRWELLGELPSNPRNLQGVVHFEERFPLEKFRYLRLFFPMTDGFEAFNGRIGTTAEFQIFGGGFPAEVILLSPIYDLRGAMNISSVEWSADTPPDTRLEIRTRTGNLLKEEYVFYDKNDLQVTEKKWNRLIPSFRGPVDTLHTAGADWSNWSRTYQPAEQIFLSPVPRRYVQLEVRLLSDDPFSAAVLRNIILNFHPPLAEQTYGEIFPNQALPGAPSDFTYFLRSLIAADSGGFDQIMLTSTAGMSFQELRLDGQVVPTAVEEMENGVRLTVEQPVQGSSLLEVDFQTTLFLNQTRFDAFLFNSALDGTIRQQVDPGDASDQVDSDVVFISLPADNKLIDNLTLPSPIFTPNGDGIGDFLRLEFDLLKVFAPRPVKVAIYDLSGHQVHLLGDREDTAGHLSLEWDGRTAEGRLTPPGVYLLRIEVKGDALTYTANRLISVAY